MKKIQLPQELCEYTIQLPQELCKYAIELIENIKKESEINKTSFKNLNLNKKTLIQLLKKEYPNLVLNQNFNFSYNVITNEVSFNVI